ncbi:MAG: MFS transporter [Acidimicrobiia bacterium]
MTSAVAPLRIPRFRALWTVSIFSNLGSFLQGVAASWLMLELTGSATWVALMAASTTLPLLFLALAAGAVADLVDRSKVLLASQALMGVAAAGMAILTATGAISPGLLLGLGLMLGVGVAFNLPAWQALVPDLVPRDMVASAVALNSVAFNVARAVGPALGGLIVATAGAQVAFGINALSYLGVISVLAVIGTGLHVPDRETGSVVTAVAAGVRYARYTSSFRRLLLLASLFAITSASVQSILPNRTDELGGGATAYGVLWGAMGLGALVAAFTRRPVVDGLGRWSIPVTIGVFGVAGLGLGLAPRIATAAAALFVAGLGWVWTLTTMNATAQLMSPHWVRGRAMSLYSLAFVGILPIGAIVSGALADVTSAGSSIAIMSVAGIALAGMATRLDIPTLGEVVTPEYSADREVPDHVDTAGGPVMVINTWVVDRADLPAFMEEVNHLRLIRLRTGAYRWRLYRNAEDPHRVSEVFLTVSWSEHLAQHRRIDDASAEAIRRARSFDRAGGPVTRHLVAVDVGHEEEWEALIAAHELYHAVDGSIPLPEPGTDPPRS